MNHSWVFLASTQVNGKKKQTHREPESCGEGRGEDFSCEMCVPINFSNLKFRACFQTGI